MVPSGWEQKPIKLLCESIIDCVNKTAKTVDYVTPFKMIRTTNVRHGKVDTVNVRYVTEETYTQWIRRGAPKEGDVIFTREAPVGEAGILNDSEGIFLGQRTMMYRVNPQKGNNLFLLYSLLSSYCQKQIEDFSNGGTVAHMRVPDCGEILINTPPLPEQQKIALTLSTWDKAISTTEALIDNSKQQKKALMQQLLTGKKRLAGFVRKWEALSLADIAKIKKGKALSSKNLEVGEFPVIAGGKTSPYKHSKYTHENIITISASGAYAGFAAYHQHKIWASDCSVVEAKKDSTIRFIYQFLLLNQIKIYSLQSGGAQPHIYPKDIEALKIKVPELDEQQKIAAVLTNADNEIDLLEQQLSDLKQEKKALMQQLLTGKRRVRVENNNLEKDCENE